MGAAAVGATNAARAATAAEMVVNFMADKRVVVRGRGS
jgi:hypothetical protein